MAKRVKRFPTHIVVFLAPAVIIYSLFMVFPLFNSLRLSFFGAGDQFGAAGDTFVGFQNYVTLLTDELLSAQF
jgi:raffinose/stachyose/melibiose transport system permease protein